MLIIALLLIQITGYLLSCLLPISKSSGILYCGIFGFSGKNPVDETKLRWLAYENKVRGSHSTGVYTVGSDKEKTKKLYKDSIASDKAILVKDFNDAIKGATSVVGHTRLATVGIVNKENSHPFIYEKGFIESLTQNGNGHPLTETVVGVHNGFVVDIMAKKFNLKPFTVDSQLIFAMLARWGGDYSILSQIEGAITTAYMVPEKYPDIIHLYRRTARELHMARTKEGIYFSSEALPLQLIGCTNILEIQDSTLVLLRDGEIMDMLEIAKPKFKSMKLGATRYNYMDTLPDDEFKDYPELKPKKYDYTADTYKKNKQHYAGEQMSIMRNFNETADEAFMNKLIVSIKNDLADWVPDKIPDFTDSHEYQDDDSTCCIVILKVTNSKDKEGLMGQVIVDSAEDSLSSITGLNGVAALKYAPDLCGKPRTLIIADPVDGMSTWEVTVNPACGKIQEIVVELPYKKKEKGGVRILYLREHGRTVHYDNLSYVYSLLSLNSLGVFNILKKTIKNQYANRKNRYIHDLREAKFMETWNQKEVRSKMKQLLIINYQELSLQVA